MTTALEYYKYATLATASYVRLGADLAPSPTQAIGGTRFAQLASDQNRLPLVQGRRLFELAAANPETWGILSYYGGDIPENIDTIAAADKSGFGATLFKNTLTGETVLAVRGTEPFAGVAVDLLSSDLGQIGIFGIALTQVVSMANYVMRLREPTSNHIVAQIKVEATLVRPAAQPYLELPGSTLGVPTPVFIKFTAAAPADGLGALIQTGEPVRLTGHSLGGHLAFMAVRLFPDIFDSNVVVFNAPGYDPDTANVLGFIDKAVPLPTFDTARLMKLRMVPELGVAVLALDTRGNERSAEALKAISQALRPGSGIEPGNPSVTSLRSEDLAPGDDLSVVASVLTGADKYGQSIDLPTEENNHVIEPFMDALALQAALEPLRGNQFDANELTRVLQASSNDNARSYEAFTEDVFRLFLKDHAFLGANGRLEAASLPISDEFSVFNVGKGSIGARNAFHDAVLRIQDAIKSQSGLQIFSLVGTDAPTIEASAFIDIGYRYALKEINPFAVIGNSALYSAHNVGGVLDLYDSNTGQGLTREYLADRSEMLVNLVLRNGADARIVNPGSAQTTDYIDRRLVTETINGVTREVLKEDKVFVGGGPDRTGVRKVAFGSERADKFEGSGFEDRIYGGGGEDRLFGFGGVDYLEAGPGGDLLVGGVGNDILDGGKGVDIYRWSLGDGNDTIRDFDGKGFVVFNGSPVTWALATSGTSWVTADGKLTLTQNSPLTIHTEDGAEIVIEDFQSGELGIQLMELPPDPAPTRSFIGDLQDLDTEPAADGIQPLADGLGNNERDPNLVFPNRADVFFGSEASDAFDTRGGDDTVFAKDGDDTIQSGAGRDSIEAGAGNDVVETGTDADIAYGGAGDDRLYADAKGAGGALVDIATAINGATGPGSGVRGDFLSGAEGEDILIGAEGNDLLAGGLGIDLLIGGAGDDNLLGDAQLVALTQEWGFFDAPHPRDSRFPVRTFEPFNTLVFEPVDGSADTIYAGAGNDFVSAEGGDDVVFGEAGDDRLFGLWGADAVMGGTGADLIFGDTPVSPEGMQAQHGDDYLDGGDGADTVFGDGGADVVLGGAGDDTLFGDDPSVAAAFQGDDYIEGGDGNDAIEGDGGSDTLLGGADDDSLFGEEGDDTLAGDAGNDQLQGGEGSDILAGGEGADTLIGEVGEDTLEGGAGADILAGGAGLDIYRADFEDIINDASGGDLIDLGVASPNEVVVSGAVIEGGKAVVISLSADADPTRAPRGLTIVGDISTQNVRFAFGGEELSSEVFFNLAFTDPLQLFGTAGDNVLRGFGGADHLVGLEGSDQLFGGASDDTLEGDTGDDQLDGGAGADVLMGGQGADVYLIGSGSGRDTILDAGDSIATDAVDFSAGITPEAVIFARQANGDLRVILDEADQITIAGHYTDPASRIEEYRFADGRIVTASELDSLTVPPITGGAGDDVLSGGAFDEVLMGLAGADKLDGKGGNDFLQGGEGEDSYVLDHGMGRDTAIDSGVNVIALRSGLTAADLAASRRGADLLVSIRGSGEGLTLADYFVTPQFWRIRDVAGVDASIEDVIAATEARAQQGAAGAREDYIASLRAAFAREFVAQGYTPLGNDAFAHTLATPASASYIAGAQYRTTVFRSTSGEITSTRTETFPLTAWDYTASGSLVRSSAQLQSQTIASDAAFILAPTATRFQTSEDHFEWMGLNWTVTAKGSVTHNSSTNFQTLLGPPFDPVTGEPTFLGTVETRDEFIFQQNFARGTLGPVPPGVPLAFPHFRELFPRIVFTQVTDKNLTQEFFEVVAGAGDNTISGGDIVLAGAGDDTVDSFGFIDGGAGNDMLFGGNVALGGPGNDTIANARVAHGGAGDDYLEGGSGASRFVLNVEDLGRDTVTDPYGLSVEEFADWHYLTLGILDWRERLYIPELDDFISLEEGIALGVLPALPQIAPHDYAALAPLYAAGAIEKDSLEFGSGITSEDLALSWGTIHLISPLSGNLGPYVVLNVGITPDNAASLVIPRSSDLLGTGIEEVRFADGTALTLGELIALAPPAPDFDPAFVPNFGPVFLLELGDGVRFIDDPDVTSIQFGSGITPDMLTLGLGSLVIRVGDEGDAIHLINFNPDDAFTSQIENFVFADGTQLTYDDLIARGFDLFGTAGDDFLSGTNARDRLRGGAGNDFYFFALSSSSDTIEDEGGEFDTVFLGDTVAPESVTVTRTEDFVTLRLNAADRIAIRWQPLAGYQIEQVQFGDGTLWDAATLEAMAVPVGRSTAPALATSIADQTASEDAVFSFAIPAGTFVDADAGDTLDFSAALADGSALPLWLAFAAATRTFSGTPVNGDVGALSVKVTATDTGGLSALDTFDVLVVNTNDAPVVLSTIADQLATEDSAFGFTVPANSFADVDAGDVLTYAASLANDDPLPLWLTFDAAARAFTGAPANNDVGAFDVTVTATDTGGLSAFDTFHVTVANTNDAPALVTGIGDQSALEDTLFSFKVPSDTFADVDAGDMLSLGAVLADESPLPAWLAFDPLSGAFNGTPTNDDVGALNIRVTATDAKGAAASDEFQLTVVPAAQGMFLEGTRHDDMLEGTDYDDTLLGRGGDDSLYGFGGDDVLAGGKGNDRLKGGAGSDVYVHELRGGNDVIEEAGPEVDALLFGEGIDPGMVRLRRHKDDLLVDLSGPNGSVKIKEWFAAGSGNVELIQFADGTSWGTEEIRERARRRHSRHDFDDGDHDRHDDRDEEHGESSQGREDDRQENHAGRKRDRMSELLAAYLEQEHRYDFETFARDLEREDRRDETLTAQEIARRWQRVNAFASGLANDDDDDARRGAVYRFNEQGLLESGAFGGGFGYTGSTGMARGIASLRALQGLEEGFQRLRS